MLGGLVAVTFAAFAAVLVGCDPCEPERCGTSAAAITVRDVETRAPLPDASVELVSDEPGAADAVAMGCVISGLECTHELLSVPADASLLRDEPEEGYGGYESEVTLPFTLRIAHDSFAPREVDLEVRTNECGVIVPRHFFIDLVPPTATEVPAPEQEAAPHC